MDQRFTYVWLATATVIAVALMWPQWIGLFLVAFFGATLTVGIKTGSLEPMYPGISRAERPRWFWFIVSFAAFVVTFNAIELIVRLYSDI